MSGRQLEMFDAARYERLTPREVEVLQKIAEGCTNAEAGAQLLIAPETVKSHSRHILSKMGARNRPHAVAIAMRIGVIS